MIQKCRHCSNQFKWSTIFKSIWDWRGFQPIECSNCKSKHYLNPIYRLIIAMCISLPVLFSTFLYKFLGSYSMVAYPIWILVLMCITPLFARYFIKV